MTEFDIIWRQRLEDLAENGRLRVLRDSARLADGRIDRGDGPLLDFSSNDYLGLARHPLVKARAASFIEEWGAGSAASRLVTGNLPPFSLIEAKIARAKRAPAALLLASGFQANASVLPALLDKSHWEQPPLVLADRLNHASLLQGAQTSGAQQIRFRHNDLGHLEDLLKANASSRRPTFIVTESVFSMDGDRADLAAINALAREYGAFLYIDEAHATGVLGEDGFGLASGLAGGHCLVMGTFSKALGSFGAYVACSADLREFLVNRCAGLIYATALPPAVLGAIDAAIDLIPTLSAERASLAANAEYFRQGLARKGGDFGASSTQIVPLIIGGEDEAMALSEHLQAHRILASAIRPPTVPPGASRLRFAFSAHHRREEIDLLLSLLPGTAHSR